MSTRVYDCPQCGAPVPFPSSVAVFAVCAHCRSMVVLRDGSAERLGEMAELPPDLSPLQCGTRGSSGGVAFELVGRLRVEWEGGSWTEWCADFADGRTGWIAETQGFFTVSFPQESTHDLPPAEHAQPGLRVQLAGRNYEVIDAKTVKCLAGEGALPFASPPGYTRQSVDLMAEDGGFASLEYHLGEPPQLYVGVYATFDALTFSNLRPVPGWDGEVAQVRNATNALNCPGCGAPASLRATGLTMAAVCGSCGAVIDTANPHARLIQEADAKIRQLRPILEIGKRGQLFGVEYEVIGMLHRADAYATWSEYLLFNPWQGFRWLVTYNGHWSFIDRLLEIPRWRPQARQLRDGRTFKHFAEADTKVLAVLGEFFWKVQRGEESELNDYVAPPYILSSEEYPGLHEITWSVGEYVAPEVVATAFGLAKPTTPTGVYLNQPNPHIVRWGSLRLLALACVAVAITLQIFFAASSSELPVAAAQFAYQRPAAALPLESAAPADSSRTQLMPEFQLSGQSQPVTIGLRAPVQNNWFGIDFVLVNADTNQTFEGGVDVEACHGVDAGEAWSEGAQTASATIPAVPPGRYYLTLDADADPQISAMLYDVEVRRGGLFLSNFVIVLLIIIAYPAWVFFRRSAFENSRWSQSDHSSSD